MSRRVADPSAKPAVALPPPRKQGQNRPTSPLLQPEAKVTSTAVVAGLGSFCELRLSRCARELHAKLAARPRRGHKPNKYRTNCQEKNIAFHHRAHGPAAAGLMGKPH